MSVYIEVNNKFVITSDRFQFILQEKKIAKSGANAGSEWLDIVGFYPTIPKLVSGLLLHNILTGEARQFSDLEKQVELLGKKCLEAFMVIRSCGRVGCLGDDEIPPSYYEKYIAKHA